MTPGAFAPNGIKSTSVGHGGAENAETLRSMGGAKRRKERGGEMRGKGQKKKNGEKTGGW